MFEKIELLPSTSERLSASYLMSETLQLSAIIKFNSKGLQLAINWCSQPLAGKLEKFPLHWLGMSVFYYFQLDIFLLILSTFTVT